jgi:hypothetical protein
VTEQEQEVINSIKNCDSHRVLRFIGALIKVHKAVNAHLAQNMEFIEAARKAYLDKLDELGPEEVKSYVRVDFELAPEEQSVSEDRQLKLEMDTEDE